jgi:hypothetical protein
MAAEVEDMDVLVEVMAVAVVTGDNSIAMEGDIMEDKEIIMETIAHNLILEWLGVQMVLKLKYMPLSNLMIMYGSHYLKLNAIVSYKKDKLIRDKRQ